MDFIIEFDYDACEPDELTLKKGDIIKNARIYEEGWMIGLLNGKEGVFPDNFGKEYKEKEVAKRESIDESNRESNTTDEELEEKQPKKKVMGVGLGNIFGGKPIVLKPTNHHLNHPKKEEDDHKDERPGLKMQQKPTEQVRVLYKYVADNKDELNLETGEIISLLKKDTGDDGWWLGRNSNGKTGVFPDNYVEIISKTNSISDEKHTSAVPTPKYGTKPNHNSLSNVKTPPPTTAPKPTPARPRPLDPGLIPSNSTAGSKGRGKPTKQTIEEQGISFDSQHVPLVGPNAGRVRGPGKRPSNINNLLSVDDDPSDLKEFITPSSAAPTSSSTVSASKNIKVSHSISEKHAAPAPPTTAISKSTRSSKDSVDSVEDNATQLNTAVNPKSNSLGRMAKLSPASDSNNNTTKASGNESQDIMNAKIRTLERRVSSLEETNTDLTRQMAELRRTHNDQVTLLTNKVHKLVKELDEDKAKKATHEIELKRIKDTVEDLENALLTRNSN